MNIDTLHPASSARWLELDCPTCHVHRLKIRLGDGAWQWDGQTLTPSYQSELSCRAHFTITDGVVDLHPRYRQPSDIDKYGLEEG